MKFEKTKGEEITEEVKDIPTDIPIPELQEKEKSADDYFKDFENSTSDIKPRPEVINGGNTEPTIDEKGKVTVFLSFSCYLLSGFHAFLYQRISGVEISTDEMTLSDSEKKIIEPMLYNAEILAWLNSLHPAVWVVMQIEYIYYMKFKAVTRLKKLEASQTKEQPQ